MSILQVLFNTDNFQVIGGVSAWICCSIGMVVFNKLAIAEFPLGCILVVIQMLFTAVVIGLFGFRTLHFGSYRDVCRWAMVVPFYAGMLLTSLLALKNASMTLCVTFRAISPILGLIVERFYPKPPRITIWVIACLLLLIAGAGMYTIGMPRTQVRGIFWIILNNIFAVGDRLLQRLFLSKDQCPVDISKTGCTVLNNVLGMIPVVVVILISKEYEELPNVLSMLDVKGYIFIVISCFVGMGISYTGIYAQSMITATSFLVLVNANKFFIIILEACFLKRDPLGPIQIAAAIITISAGILYGKAHEHANSEDKTKGAGLPQEVQPIMKKV